MEGALELELVMQLLIPNKSCPGPPTPPPTVAGGCAFAAGLAGPVYCVFMCEHVCICKHGQLVCWCV